MDGIRRDLIKRALAGAFWAVPAVKSLAVPAGLLGQGPSGMAMMMTMNMMGRSTSVSPYTEAPGANPFGQ